MSTDPGERERLGTQTEGGHTAPPHDTAGADYTVPDERQTLNMQAQGGYPAPHAPAAADPAMPSEQITPSASAPFNPEAIQPMHTMPQQQQMIQPVQTVQYVQQPSMSMEPVPATTGQTNTIPAAEAHEDDGFDVEKPKSAWDGWWWKSLIVLAALFFIILFFVWIGPSFIWGGNANDDALSGVAPPTFNPTLEPTMEPTLAPITAEPTMSPTTPFPSRSPTVSPTPRPTAYPTSCPLDQGSYEQYENCNIVDAKTEVCDYVENGQMYDYEMESLDCTQTVTCVENSACFNSSHYSFGSAVYEGAIQHYVVGDERTCLIKRDCGDDACHTCSKSHRYKMYINVMVIVSAVVFWMR